MTLTERSKSAVPVAGSRRKDHRDVCARKATKSSYHNHSGEMFSGEKVRRITREGILIIRTLQLYKTKHSAALENYWVNSVSRLVLLTDRNTSFIDSSPPTIRLN